LWTARYDGPGNGTDIARSITAAPDGSMVFVTGSSDGPGTDSDYATIAYTADTGAQRWAGRYDGPGGGDDTAYGVAASPDASTVFVTGGSLGAGTGSNYATVAYDLRTGVVRWARRYEGLGNGSANAVIATPDGTTVVVTGRSLRNGTGDDYVTIAYDADTGAVRWGRRYDGPDHGRDVAESAASSPDGAMVFVTGRSDGTGSTDDYATIAYDARTGTVGWARRYDGPDARNDIAHAVSASPDGSRVLVTGSSGRGTGTDYFTIAYEATLEGTVES